MHNVLSHNGSQRRDGQIVWCISTTIGQVVTWIGLLDAPSPLKISKVQEITFHNMQKEDDDWVNSLLALIYYLLESQARRVH